MIPALLATDRGTPDDERIREALYGWVFNKTRREAGPSPEELTSVVRWLETNTVKLTALTDAALVRKALDLLATRLDGKAAAATTAPHSTSARTGARWARYARTGS